MSKSPANISEDLVKKLKTAVEKQNKDKKITFRVTSDIYEELEIMAKLSSANLSRLMEVIIKDYLQMVKDEYEAEEVEE